MPLGDIGAIRALTNLTPDDISDEDLSAILLLATRHVIEDISALAVKEDITAARVSDANIYQLAHAPLVGFTDFEVKITDVIVEAKNPHPTTLAELWEFVAVAAVDADAGFVELANPPQDKALYATYRYLPKKISRGDVEDLINIYSAHVATVRLEGPGTLSIVDLDKNALVVKDTEDRFWQLYASRRKTILGATSFRAVAK